MQFPAKKSCSFVQREKLIEKPSNMAGFSHYLQPYYIANYLLISSWIWIRNVVDMTNLQTSFSGPIMTGEIAVILSMTLYIYKKTKWCNSWDSLASKAFLYYQSLIALMLFFVSLSGMVWYIVCCVVVWLMFRPQACVNAPHVLELDDISFEEHIATKKKKKDGKTWLVFFTANWHTECIFFSHLFADLAEEFGSTEYLRFGRLDDRHKSVFDVNKVNLFLNHTKLHCTVVFELMSTDGLDVL